jgi:hypothetical protein
MNMTIIERTGAETIVPNAPDRLGDKRGKVQTAMKQLFRCLIVAAALAGCAPSAPPPPPAPAALSVNAPPGFPANLRWDLVPKWIQWSDGKATVSWPPDDGCARAPAAKTLRRGTMIDRFGAETGSFFSPKGASFASRAVPYVCRQMDYRVYRVMKPIPVKACDAAPWFGEPGGAVQDQTSVPASQLVAAGKLKAVTYVAGGGPGPFPQCEGP